MLQGTHRAEFATGSCLFAGSSVSLSSHRLSERMRRSSEKTYRSAHRVQRKRETRECVLGGLGGILDAETRTRTHSQVVYSAAHSAAGWQGWQHKGEGAPSAACGAGRTELHLLNRATVSPPARLRAHGMSHHVMNRHTTMQAPPPRPLSVVLLATARGISSCRTCPPHWALSPWHAAGVGWLGSDAAPRWPTAVCSAARAHPHAP